MLVNCVAYHDGRKLADVAVDEIDQYLARPGCFVWVALRDPEPAELEVMQREFGLHSLAVEDARHGHQRPKIEEYGDSLFVVLHTLDAQGVDIAAGEVAVFAGPNYVLSIRSRSPQGFSAVRARCEREPELLRQGAGFVLYALMDAVVDRYFPVIQVLEEELETAEDRIFGSGPTRANIEGLYALKRKLTTLQHAARPLLEATGKLYGGRVPQVCASTQEYFRDVYDHLLRITQSIESLREMVAAATAVNLSLISLHENETTKRLAAYAALVALPTFIASLYGMNFEHLPGLRWPLGYAVTLGAMATLDFLLWRRFRRAGWL
ncbi:MAG TPA: magnesium/cobalt transporter CorA [Anaeromyxobacteraceae bacterium]|jgi:magnesium transporter